jgi:translation initiation factor IF-3
VNNAIRVPEIRVVNEDGQQLGIMSPDAARDIAARLGLDLVEISPNASPPVVKIMDYGRYKYEQKKKAAAAKKTQHQIQIKEVKFRPQINEHDLDFKLNNARRFLLDGDKVKCTVMFRGREIVHAQLGRDLLRLVQDRLADLAKPETQPQMEGRMLSMLMAPERAIVERLRAERARASEEARAEQASEDQAAEGDDGPEEDVESDEERSSA